jgi:hypothetical protein
MVRALMLMLSKTNDQTAKANFVGPWCLEFGSWELIQFGSWPLVIGL